MKKKIIIGSILVVLMLMLLPSTTSLQLNTRLNRGTSFPGIEEIQNMDINGLMDFIVEMSKDYPLLQEEIICQIEEMEDEKTLQDELNKPLDSNQSIIEKIWTLVFNYRLFRFSVSAFFYLSFQSKLTLWRTLTWSIKLIRWIKVGIILGIVDPTFGGPPDSPQISFEMDIQNNTLTVESVYPDDVSWEDIDEIGSGTCDLLPTGTVTVGDQITNCTGVIVLRYIPTNGIIGIFEF